MTTIFKANSIGIAVEEILNYIAISFADDKCHINQYIIFQQAIKLEIGEEANKAYIEHNDQLYGAYGGITKVILKRNCLEIFLDELTSKKINTEQHIQVLFAQDGDQFEEMINQFERIFWNDPGVFIREF
jgi:hypothetical protein